MISRARIVSHRSRLARRCMILAGGSLLGIILTGLVAVRLSQAHGEAVWLVATVAGVGVACVLFSLVRIQRVVVRPVGRLVDEIGAMQQTGRITPLSSPAGSELEVIASGFNHLVARVEEQNRRLREHLVDLQRANAELDQLASLKDDFLVTINHQLRTPLTTLKEGISLIQEELAGSLPEDQRSLIRMLGENVERLNGLVEHVLDLSLLKSGRRPLTRVPSDPALLLRQSQARWQESAHGRSITLACGELPPVYMDPEAIREVMDHLLRNALQHTPEHREIGVEARAGGSFVQVSVRDHGPGLSREQLEQLFQPFAHLQTPDAPGSQGSGLGLAFCRQVIERHRGSMLAESTEGQGTALTFTLPIASTQFLFEEACRCAQEDAEYDQGQFALMLVAPIGAARGSAMNAASGQEDGGSTTRREPRLPSTPLGTGWPVALARDFARPASTQELRAYPEGSAGAGVMPCAEQVLRRNTHQGDRFVWLEERLLAVIAVTGPGGSEAMATRLRLVLDQARLTVQVACALFPGDGETPAHLLEAARRRLLDQPVPSACAHPGPPSVESAGRSNPMHDRVITTRSGQAPPHTNTVAQQPMKPDGPQPAGGGR